MIKRGLPFLLLFLTYIGLLLQFPLKRKGLWFPFSLATISLYFVLHILRKEKNYSIEFLFSIALLIAGVAQTFVTPWLRIAYFPFIVFLTVFYGLKTIIPLSLLIPLLELSNFMSGEKLIEEIAFIVSLIVTASISSLFFRTLRKEKNMVESSLRTIKETAQNINSGAQIGSFTTDEKLISQHLESIFKSDEEIKDLLTIVKNTVFADSVTLFVSSGSGLILRCSTEDSGTIIPSGGGIINLCIREKRPIVLSEIDEKGLEIGYLKKGKISSLIAVPVIDGNFMLGVMTADSARFHAFSDGDSNTFQMFSKQLTRILQRERVYPHINRSHTSLKILHEESSRLLSALNVDVIVQRLMEGAYRIAPSEMVFFMAKGKEFEILHQVGLLPQDKKTFSLKDTLLDMVVKNNEPFYLSDVRNYRLPIMPFKIDNIGSVFALPMLYEKETIGILTLLSEKINALNPYQIELLEVLVNQAATSIANARFHEEIERMATTDGLTGLFNHRHFQEKLSAEFKRLERFSEPLSLMLIDIDYFKKINDTYGHPTGDKVLQGIADILRNTIRSIDIPARYGGEEFTVILPGTDSKGAKNMAERLRRAVMGTTFNLEGKSAKVTISIGISTSIDSSGGKESLIERADKALYHAKKSGRNQSVLWSEITS